MPCHEEERGGGEVSSMLSPLNLKQCKSLDPLSTSRNILDRKLSMFSSPERLILFFSRVQAALGKRSVHVSMFLSDPYSSSSPLLARVSQLHQRNQCVTLKWPLSWGVSLISPPSLPSSDKTPRVEPSNGIWAVIPNRINHERHTHTHTQRKSLTH